MPPAPEPSTPGLLDLLIGRPIGEPADLAAEAAAGTPSRPDVTAGPRRGRLWVEVKVEA